MTLTPTCHEISLKTCQHLRLIASENKVQPSLTDTNEQYDAASDKPLTSLPIPLSQ